MGIMSNNVSVENKLGQVQAAILSAGASVLIIGIVQLLSQRYASFRTATNFIKAVGPFSGKIVIGYIGWLVVWAILDTVFRKRSVSGKAFGWSFGLMLFLGTLLTYPPFLETVLH